jgi:hypothetical protein
MALFMAIQFDQLGGEIAVAAIVIGKRFNLKKWWGHDYHRSH